MRRAAFGVQFVNHTLEAFFKLAAVHGTGDERADIQLQNTLVQ